MLVRGISKKSLNKLPWKINGLMRNAIQTVLNYFSHIEFVITILPAFHFYFVLVLISKHGVL